VIWRYML